MLYTAKGTAALLVPLANVLVGKTGDWQTVFWTGAVMNVVAAIAALTVLKPMRASQPAFAETPAALYTEG